MQSGHRGPDADGARGARHRGGTAGPTQRGHGTLMQRGHGTLMQTGCNLAVGGKGKGHRVMTATVYIKCHLVNVDPEELL